MTEGKTTQEPTMEEILASIRRIISEDGTDKAETPAEESTQNGFAEAEPVAEAAPESVLKSARELAGEDEDDDLVLTDMVVGDDTVMALEEEPAVSAPEPIQPPEPVQEPEPALEPLHEPEPDLVLEQMDQAPEPEPLVVSPPPIPEPVRAPPPEEPARAAPPPRETAPAQPSPPPRRETNPEPDPMEAELVSPQVAAASAASMAQLVARKAQQAADQHGGGDGLLVETLVRQAVEPMLRDWLDVHLQGIVEKLVRREVERISRRAELG